MPAAAADQVEVVDGGRAAGDEAALPREAASVGLLAVIEVTEERALYHVTEKRIHSRQDSSINREGETFLSCSLSPVEVEHVLHVSLIDDELVLGRGEGGVGGVAAVVALAQTEGDAGTLEGGVGD